VGKFTFLADFVVVDYESDLIVPLILGRPFLRTARALIDVHGEEMILRDGDESSELAKLKHVVNQQTSAVTTAMTAMLKQFQSNPPPAQVKSVEEIYVTCGGAHPYYQCLTAGGNTFPEYRDNIQGYVSAAIVDLLLKDLPFPILPNSSIHRRMNV
nr:reverse transcriptase domain-containing protein [Tanacetum cinerariifolium]